MTQISARMFNQKYKFLNKISQGGFGVVFKIQLRDISRKRFALKRIKLMKNQPVRQILKEISIQKYLKHPLTIQIIQYYVTKSMPHNGNYQTIVGIVIQLGQRSLAQTIKMQILGGQSYSLSETIHFCHQFIKLFNYFQSKNIVHRDIKPQNFIKCVKQQHSSNLLALGYKLADFGTCRQIDDIDGISGSYTYFSPLLKKAFNNPYSNITYRSNPFKDDVYSLGVTFYQFITKRVNQSNFSYVNQNIYSKTKSNQLAAIVEFMLTKQQQKRPDFKNLLRLYEKIFLIKPQIQHSLSINREEQNSQKQDLTQFRSKPNQTQKQQMGSQNKNSKISQMSVEQNKSYLSIELPQQIQKQNMQDYRDSPFSSNRKLQIQKQNSDNQFYQSRKMQQNYDNFNYYQHINKKKQMFKKKYPQQKNQHQQKQKHFFFKNKSKKNYNNQKNQQKIIFQFQCEKLKQNQKNQRKNQCNKFLNFKKQNQKLQVQKENDEKSIIKIKKIEESQSDHKCTIKKNQQTIENKKKDINIKNDQNRNSNKNKQNSIVQKQQQIVQTLNMEGTQTGLHHQSSKLNISIPPLIFQIALGEDTKIVSIYKWKRYLIVGCLNGKLKLIYLNQYNIFIIMQIIRPIYFNSKQQKGHQGFLPKKILGQKNQYFSIIQKDLHGNIYLCSSKGNIYQWNIQKLQQQVKYLKNYIKHQINKNNIFGKKIQKVNYYFRLNPEVQKRIVLPIQVSSSNYVSDICLNIFQNNRSKSYPQAQNKIFYRSILCFFAVDQQHFILGFDDGFVYIKWNQKQYLFQSHSKPVTSILLFENKVFTSSIDGTIKCFNMVKGVYGSKQMRYQQPIIKIFLGKVNSNNFKTQVNDLKVNQIRQGQYQQKNSIYEYYLNAICHDNNLLQININNFEEYTQNQGNQNNIDIPKEGINQINSFSFLSTNTELVISDTITGFFFNRNSYIFTLNSNGEIFINGIYYINIGSKKGWNCVSGCQQEKIMYIGGFQGQIRMIKWY